MSFKLEATGNTQSQDPDFLLYVINRVVTKNILWMPASRRRRQIIDRMETLNPMFIGQTSTSSIDMLVPRRRSGANYSSGLMHQVWNSLQGTKLDPDFVEISPMQMDYDKAKTIQAAQVTQVHKQMRTFGEYEEARMDAQKDFILGHSYIQQGWTLTEAGEPDMPEYQHAPFDEMRGKWGETDTIRMTDMPIGLFADEFGEEMLEIVSAGRSVDPENTEVQETIPSIKNYKDEIDTIQVVRYWDEARKIYAVILGGHGYIETFLEGDEYPFIGKNDKGFTPIKESLFYVPPSGWIGWGPLHLVMPLAWLDTTIISATADMAQENAGPMRIINSDDSEIKDKWYKWRDNRRNGINTPIFASGGFGIETRTDVVTTPPDNNSLQVWTEFINAKVTQLTGIDIRSLTDQAPTLGQQGIRVRVQNQVRISVLRVNTNREKQFAMNELYWLKNGKSKFKNMEIEVITPLSENRKTDAGELPTINKKISKIMADFNNISMQLNPRLDGAFDDQTAQEIESLRNDMGLVTPGTEASVKIKEQYFQKKSPKLGLQQSSFVSPAPQAQIEEEPVQLPNNQRANATV